MDDSIMKYRVSSNLKTIISGKHIYLLLSELSGEKGYVFIKEIFDDDGTRKANEYILK